MSNLRVVMFVASLCFAAALILSSVSSFLSERQKKAKILDQSKQLLISCKILSPDGYFLIDTGNLTFEKAVFDSQQKVLTLGDGKKASSQEILFIYESRVIKKAVNNEGALTDEGKHILYLIMPNLPPNQIGSNTRPTAYVIPISGFGLWDAIYGYLAIDSNGDTVIGTTWYDQQETAGLGAVIASTDWQKQFLGKSIFQKSASETTDLKSAPLGITVIKGKVKEVLGSSPKADSSVDGITGATLTSEGVTNAYRSSLAPYRNFLIKVHQGS